MLDKNADGTLTRYGQERYERQSGAHPPRAQPVYSFFYDAADGAEHYIAWHADCLADAIAKWRRWTVEQCGQEVAYKRLNTSGLPRWVFFWTDADGQEHSAHCDAASREEADRSWAEYCQRKWSRATAYARIEQHPPAQ